MQRPYQWGFNLVGINPCKVTWWNSFADWAARSPWLSTCLDGREGLVSRTRELNIGRGDFQQYKRIQKAFAKAQQAAPERFLALDWLRMILEVSGGPFAIRPWQVLWWATPWEQMTSRTQSCQPVQRCGAWDANGNACNWITELFWL